MQIINHETIKQIAKERGVKTADLIALARGNDPFYVGTRAHHEWGEWFAGLFNELGYGQGVHVRRVHYSADARSVLMPDGNTYANTDKCWGKLTMASKYARYLGLVDASLFADKRSVEAVDYSAQQWNDEEPTINILTREFEATIELPDFPALPRYRLDGFHARQRYHLEIWCEKSTMNDVLEPICREFGAFLQIGVGEMSITRTLDLVSRLAKADKPARIFYVSDFDPAGQSIPVAVSRKIEFYNQQLGLELDAMLFPVMLTEEQIITYSLPRKPIKATERRKESFEARYGVGATELDALEALHPGLMGQILRKELGRFYDAKLERRVSDAYSELDSELWASSEEALSYYEEEVSALRDEYDELKREIEQMVSGYNERRFGVWQAIRDELREDCPDLALDVPEADFAGFVGGALFDSDRDYFEQLDAYKEFQRK